MLQAHGLGKRFGAVRALQNVDLQVHAGEIVGLVGVNGAGKSTLMNILDGVLAPSEGEILIGGEPVRFDDPLQAHRAGIGFIHQHSTSFDELSVAENVAIQADGSGRFDRRALGERAKGLLERLGAGHIDVAAKTSTLTIGERQMVDVARALAGDPKVLLFDEPTSSLSRAEAERLFEVIRSLRAEGRTIVYTSHFLDDVLALSDRVVVLRDGVAVLTATRDELSRERLVSTMLARASDTAGGVERPVPSGQPALVVRELAPAGRPAVSFTLARGEVLGLWGVLGAGRTEILRALVGLDRASVVELSLVDASGASRRLRPAQLLREVGFVTEDRHQDGLFLGLPIWQNTTFAALRRFAGALGRMRRSGEREATEVAVTRLSIKLGRIDDPVSSLSGGNQQKVVLGRWLERAPSLYLFDEPTHGVDVGAKAQIHRVVHELADAGASAIVVSSEVEEMFALADRVLVLREGRLVDELQRRDFDRARLLAAS